MIDRTRLRPHMAPLPNFGERERAAEAKRLAALEALLGIAWCEECGTYHEAKDGAGEVWAKNVPQAPDPAPPAV